MRDYSNLVNRVEGLSGASVAVSALGEVEGYPVLCVGLSRNPSLPTVFLNGGTHGDEPAGVETALAFLEGDHGRWLSHFQFQVTPCLNPYGYVHNTRLNRNAVDINWAFLRDDVAEIDIIRSLVEGQRFEVVIDFHEDWESPGYYLYEQVRGRSPVGPRVTRRVSEVCPLNLNRRIENEEAKNGVIFPDRAVEKRRRGKGIPIALFRHEVTDHMITSETPTGEPMKRRIQAHLTALEVILASHCDAVRKVGRVLGVRRIDLKAARIKPAYKIAPEDVVAPDLTPKDWADFECAVSRFNRGEYWESHEAWEQVWRRHPEPSRIFFQGLIQLAAAYHQLERGIYHGVVKHFNNADLKLRPFPDRFLGVGVSALKEAIRKGLEEAERLGEEGLDRFDPGLLTSMRFERPNRVDGSCPGFHPRAMP